MAISLPKKTYGAVQSLGRQDPYMPIRTAQSITSGLMQIGKVAQTWVDAEVSKELTQSIADYKEQMSSLRTELLSQPMINVDDYPDIDFGDEDLRDIQTVSDPATGRLQRTVPAWRVIGKIYDTREEQLRSEVTKNLPEKTKGEFRNRVSEFASASANQIVGQQYRHRYADMKAVFNRTYEQHVNNLDIENAIRTIEDADRLGIISKLEKVEMVQTLENDIAQVVVNREMATEDPNDLDVLAVAVQTTDLPLTPLQRIKARTNAMERAYKLRERQYKLDQRVRKAQSEKDEVELMLMALRAEESLPDSVLADAIEEKNMNLENAKSLLAFRNTHRNQLRSERKEYSLAAFNEMRAEMLTLSYVSDGSIQEKADALEMRIREKAGINANGEIINENPELLAEQHAQLITELRKIKTEPLMDEDVKRFVNDYMYPILTGASKGRSTWNPSTQANLINAAEAEWALREAALAEGAAFDVNQWWSDNKSRYITKNLRENMAKLKAERVANELIQFQNRKDGTYNIPAVTEYLHKRYNRENFEDRAQAKKILQDLIDHNSLTMSEKE